MSSSSSSLSFSSSSSAASGPYGIKISRRITTDPVASHFRLQAQAHSAIGMPAEIFRYEVTGRTAEGVFTLAFNGVATPLDLEQWRAEAPDPELTTFPEFVRSDKLDLIFPRVEFLDDAWAVLLEETTQLVNDLSALDELTEDTTVSFGDPEPDDTPGPWWD